MKIFARKNHKQKSEIARRQKYKQNLWDSLEAAVLDSNSLILCKKVLEIVFIPVTIINPKWWGKICLWESDVDWTKPDCGVMERFVQFPSLDIRVVNKSAVFGHLHRAQHE